MATLNPKNVLLTRNTTPVWPQKIPRFISPHLIPPPHSPSLSLSVTMPHLIPVSFCLPSTLPLTSQSLSPLLSRLSVSLPFSVPTALSPTLVHSTSR
jgi:hypothetical protein